jgi:radical SAM protein with 4Fe4S-binding SPASM domain
VSVDGFEGAHDQFRQKDGSFARAIKTLSQLKELRQYYPGFSVGANVTIHGDNKSSVIDLIRYFKQEMDINAGVTLIRGNPMEERLIREVGVSDYKEIIQEIDKLKKSVVLRGLAGKIISARERLGHELVEQVDRTGMRNYDCYAGTLMGVISENGSVFPCEMLPGSSMGNLQDFSYDIEKLWNNERQSGLRANIAARKCACTYECQYTCNILYNVRMWPALLRNVLWSSV